MRRALALLAIAAGCTNPSAPTDFGVNVRVDASRVSTDDRAAVDKVTLIVTGDSQSPYSVDLKPSPITSGELRFHYVPGVMSGTLLFHVDASAAGAAKATGASDPVMLIAGQAVDALVILGAPSSSNGDGGSDDGGAADLLPAAKPNGQPCTTAADCQSGFCADGVCCNSACTEACKVCNKTNLVGTCSPASDGDTPLPMHATCTADAMSTCMKDGKCDSNGACRLWALGTVCKASSCVVASGTLTPQSTCDGKGMCQTPGTINCAPFKCKDTSVCISTCTGNGDCSGTNTCISGSCGLKGNGASCATGTECQTGFCADTVCCDSACNGTCQYCALAASLGTCATVPAGQDPRNVCPANPPCVTGACNGTQAACAYAPNTTSCRSASCDSTTNTQTNPTTCDGAGSCPTATTKPCGAYNCNATACKTTCAGNGDCATGYYCSGTTCVPTKGLAQACGGGAECSSGYCAPEGICCSSACTGQCQYCDGSGICQYASGGVHAPRAACTTNAGYPVCNGSCNGSSPDCSYPTSQCYTTSCMGQTGCGLACACLVGVLSCTNGFCSNGACNVTCTCCQNGYNCFHSPITNQYSGCYSSCTSNNMCQSGYTCSGNTCQ